MKHFSLCLPTSREMGFIFAGWSVGDGVTAAVISICTDSEVTTHLMHRDKQDLASHVAEVCFVDMTFMSVN